MANWLRKLMPKQEKFFPLFNQHAEIVEEVSGRLKAGLAAPKAPVDGDIEPLVAQGRALSAKILDDIRGAFVTPFDRTDIKQMSSSMQALLEEMRALARSNFGDAKVSLTRFGDLIAECAGELKRGVARLDKLDEQAGELKQMRERIAALRSTSADLRDSTLLELFQHAPDDPIATLASTRLIERLGGVVDRFDAVADHIDDLVLDHV